jgi:uncharacterized protein (TIGR03086 family)
VLDLGPATREVARIVRAIGEDQLAGPTPCEKYSVGDLLDHVDGLAIAFTEAAQKSYDASVDTEPQQPSAARLAEGWRDRIPARLAALADAWREPAAWTGTTRAGGVDLPGEVGGQVALNEVVTHGWDLARATGQEYRVDEASVAGAAAFVEPFSGPGSEDQRGDAFGPVVSVPDDAPSFDRLIGMNGRNPAWTPPPG